MSDSSSPKGGSRPSGSGRADGTGFDRIKSPGDRPPRRAQPDPEGRAALFSDGPPPQPGPLDGLGLHCSRCGATSPLDAETAVRSALPLFLLAPWKDHPIFAVCPRGRHRAWLKITRAAG